MIGPDCLAGSHADYAAGRGDRRVGRAGDYESRRKSFANYSAKSKNKRRYLQVARWDTRWLSSGALRTTKWSKRMACIRLQGKRLRRAALATRVQWSEARFLGGEDLVAEGLKKVWIRQMGRTAVDAPSAAWMGKIAAALLTCDVEGVRYDAAGVGLAQTIRDDQQHPRQSLVSARL